MKTAEGHISQNIASMTNMSVVSSPNILSYKKSEKQRRINRKEHRHEVNESMDSYQ